jgi:hypothetical protein
VSLWYSCSLASVAIQGAAVWRQSGRLPMTDTLALYTTAIASGKHQVFTAAMKTDRSHIYEVRT